MPGPVPCFVRSHVAQPIVGAEVDDAHAAVQHLHDDPGRGGVRQTTENAIALSGDRFRRQVLECQVDPPSQLRMNGRHVRLTFLPARQRGDPCLRMAQQDLDQLQRRITGCTEYAHPHHVHACLNRNDSGSPQSSRLTLRVEREQQCRSSSSTRRVRLRGKPGTRLAPRDGKRTSAARSHCLTRHIVGYDQFAGSRCPL